MYIDIFIAQSALKLIKPGLATFKTCELKYYARCRPRHFITTRTLYSIIIHYVLLRSFETQFIYKELKAHRISFGIIPRTLSISLFFFPFIITIIHIYLCISFFFFLRAFSITAIANMVQQLLMNYIKWLNN